MAVAAGDNGSVTVVVAGGGARTVAAGDSRTFSVPAGSASRLTAKPAPGYGFAGWDGACAGSANPVCALSDGERATARFEPVACVMTLSSGPGGSVAFATGDEAGTVFAGGSAELSVTIESELTLAVVPPPAGWRFAGWGGDCASPARALICDDFPDTAFDDGRLSVHARFEPVPATLAVTAGPGGSVAVSVGPGAPATVAAGSSRGFSVTVETSATLVAAPAAGYRLGRWDGECAGQLAECELAEGALTDDAFAEAVFEAVPTTLAVTAGRGGSVAVSGGGGAPATVAAGSSRGFSVTVEAPATLAAAPAAGYAFAGWDGDCPDAADPACAFGDGAFDGEISAAARFAPAGLALAVSAGAGGSVAVSVGAGAPATVAGGSSRGFSVTVETSATLVAAPAAGYRLGRWDGECAGQLAECELAEGALTDDAFAEAVFEAVPTTLAVTAGRGGSVAVSGGGGAPATVAAGSSRGFSVTVEAPATLAAAPAAGYAFAGWDGDCPDAADPACAFGDGAFDGDISAAARFAPAGLALAVSAGAGGSVAVSVGAGAPATVAGGSSRGFSVTVETSATLVAAPAAGYRLGRWDGACAGQLAECELAEGALTDDAFAEAVFEAVPTTLAVTAGTGGSVAVSVGAGAPATVAGGSSRGFSVTVETSATLVAAPAAGYRLGRWDGACAGQLAECELAEGALTDDAFAEAVFEAVPTTLAVTAGRGGSVAVSVGPGAPATVAAGSSRGFSVTVETSATLVAAPAPGWRFERWDGDCPDAADPACAFGDGAFDGEISAAARFAPAGLALAVSAGTGGSVAVSVGAGAPATVAAGSSRGFSVTVETSATLVAAPAAGYRLGRWDGECAGQLAECELAEGALTDDAFAEAVFEAVPTTLAVTAGRGGSVAVSVGPGAPATVAAGSSRGFSVTVETPATLVAAPAAGYRLGRWDGECAGQPAECELAEGALTADASAAAVFEAVPTTLAVTAGRGGSVAVSVGPGAPATVAGGSSRGFSVTVEAPATLAAAPAAGYAFAGWDGDCALVAGRACGFGAAAFDGEISAAARFAPAELTLTVTAGRGGSVAVTVSGAVTTVGAGESAEFAVDVETSATLTAEPLAGYRFERWDGECAGRGAECELAEGALTADASAAAAFEAVPATLAVTAGPNGSVAVSVSGAVTTVGAGESAGFAVDVETSATLTAEPLAGYRFEHWDGECAGQPAECELAEGALAADASAKAVFEPDTYRLSVTAVGGGRVDVSFTDGVFGVPVDAKVQPGLDNIGVFNVSAQNPVELAPLPIAGWRLGRWDGACAGQRGACELPAGALTDDAFVTARFERTTRTLTASAAEHGAVRVTIGPGPEVDETVPAGSSATFSVFVDLVGQLLEAMPTDAHYRFSRWTGACAGSGPVCELPQEAFAADMAATALFAPTTYTLTVSSGRGGSTRVSVGGRDAGTVAPEASRVFDVTVEDSATLTVLKDRRYRLGRWTGMCAGTSSRYSVCLIDSGEFTTASASAGAVFEPVTLGFHGAVSNAGGSMEVAVDGQVVATLPEATGRYPLPFTVESEVALTALPDELHRFERWDGACAQAPTRVCELPPGALDDGGSVSVRFAERFGHTGPGQALLDGSALSAVPTLPGGFAGWLGAPCDGSASPDCDLSGLPRDDPGPVARFHPFVPGGIKALSFGLAGYPGGAPDHFRISYRRAPGAGYSTIPGLERLSPGSGPARLPVSVHRLAWGAGGYLTEACGAGGECRAADGGERTLAQADSAAVAGYFKAPVAGSVDFFGDAVALSSDGTVLAVGAPFEDSSATGALAPSDPLWAAALADGGAGGSGAVYVYRRSGRWALDAFVKAPVAGAGDRFGEAVALSSGGAVLAVGAPFEDSSATGALAPSDPPWAAALADDGVRWSGAAYVYRRGSDGRWAAEAFVKAPAADIDDFFGGALALSADGRTLAVGADGEDSSVAGVHFSDEFVADNVSHPDRPPALQILADNQWAEAQADNDATNSGAAYVYHRGSDGGWIAEAFVKAPVAGADDRFGGALALSANGRTLAVGADEEDSSAAGALISGVSASTWMPALADSGAADSGAAYVFRRASNNLWAAEAFIKAPARGAGDRFGGALALSGRGRALAVGAHREDSAATGALAPSDPPWAAALAGGGAADSGAAYVFRRTESRDGGWSPEAFIKAPAPGAGDEFGGALALSFNGGALAVGAQFEDSSATGAHSPAGPRWSGALDDSGAPDSGAVYTYRQGSDGLWAAEAFVKAPNTGAGDRFGAAVAPADDGLALAVGARFEGGAAQPRPVSGASAEIGAGFVSGAAYLH